MAFISEEAIKYLCNIYLTVGNVKAPVVPPLSQGEGQILLALTVAARSHCIIIS